MSKCIQTKLLLKFDVAFGIFGQYFVGEFWYLKMKVIDVFFMYKNYEYKVQWTLIVNFQFINEK